MHYAGYAESRAKVLAYSRQELIDLIESLFGWDWHDDGLCEGMKDEYTDAALLQEALFQHEVEWTVPVKYEHHYQDAEA